MKHLLTIAALLLSFIGIAQTDCTNPYDGNNDGAVTISDLLDLLGLFGDVDTDQDGIWDSVDECVDATACNYDADPTEPCAYIDVLGICGGGCVGDGDGDGICDDEDDCVGILDECGVCNGPGPTEIVIDEVVITYDSIYLPVDGEWFVYAVNADTTFSYTCAPSFSTCGDPVSYQSYDYATVLIGEQCWFAENLRNENYQNGDPIPANLSDNEWYSTVTGHTTVYGEGNSQCSGSPENVCDENYSLAAYGRLYNGAAVLDNRGLCPTGWHIPTDQEWMILEQTLGMSEEVLFDQGPRGTDEARKMKAISSWVGSTGTNESGFSALPAGSRYDDGAFAFAGQFTAWYSTTSINDRLWIRYLYTNDQIDRTEGMLWQAMSIRCLQDSE